MEARLCFIINAWGAALNLRFDISLETSIVAVQPGLRAAKPTKVLA
jgi:hypothetical protein